MKKRFVKICFKFMDLSNDEKGQSMVEYGMIIGLIAVVLILTLTALGTSIRDLYPVLESYLPDVI